MGQKSCPNPDSTATLTLQTINARNDVAFDAKSLRQIFDDCLFQRRLVLVISDVDYQFFSSSIFLSDFLRVILEVRATCAQNALEVCSKIVASA